MEDDFESALFEPWTILPTQVATNARWESHESGQLALRLAVLEDAIRCIERGRRCRHHQGIRKLADEAAAWVRCNSREWPFAFGNICDVLGLDVDAVRTRLLADGEHFGGRPGRRVPVRHIGRGPARTSVRLRATSRAT